MRSTDVVDTGRGQILLGVGLSFGIVPNVDLAFAILGLGLADLEILSDFDWTLTDVEVVVGGYVRRTLPVVVAWLGFGKLVLVAAHSNPAVTVVANF